MRPNQVETDSRWMREAIVIAENGLGTTAPNPSVGAVLVREGVELSRAVTQPGGRPHAETEALRLAGAGARGATLYVTLEPCSHVGKTGPCAEALIAAGVARVVVGIEDPDPRVAGRGLAFLRAAGVEVVLGVEAKACRWVTLGHILRVTERRPMVLIKMALDEFLHAPLGIRGQPLFVTGPEARAVGHWHRARSDAILVGSRTVVADDPQLTCRVPGLESRSPKRVVLDSNLVSLTPRSKLAQSAGTVPLWVFTSAEASQENRTALEKMGVRIIVIDKAAGRLDLRQMVRQLADDGITRLMVEGGQTVWRSFLDKKLVDEVIIFVQAGGPSPGSDPMRRIGMDCRVPLKLVEQGEIGGDKWFRFQRVGT